MSNKSAERKTLRTDWKELPIDKELSSILLDLANARARLINYHESITDRDIYESRVDVVDDAEEKIMDVMRTIANDLIGFECVNLLLDQNDKR